jgi:hypothetical protein
MELSPSWEAANFAAIHKLLNTLCYPTVHYRVHKCPPLFPVLSQINPIHTTLYYLRSFLILFTQLRLSLCSGLLPSGFLTHNINQKCLQNIRKTCKERDLLENTGVDCSVILKCVLSKYGMDVETGLFWIRIRLAGGSVWKTAVKFRVHMQQ